jgi:hypothetical protein
MVGAWTLKELWPVSVSFGDLCYSDKTDMDVVITWRFLTAQYESTEQIKHDWRWGLWRNNAGNVVSMVQGDLPIGSGCCNLDWFYNSQFVQNEEQRIDKPAKGQSNFTYICEHVPILDGSMCGTVYVGDTAVQIFTHCDGKFLFKDLSGVLTPTGIESTFVKADKTVLNLVTGELSLSFNRPPGPHRIVISYEYNLECNSGV